MDCREVCEKMYDYIEHQLSQEELKAFEEHMKDCKHCQDEYYKLEKITVKLKNIKDIDPPKDLKYKILENIKKEEKQAPKILYFKKYSYVAATIAIFICGFYIIKAMENSPVKNNIYIAQNIEQSTENITEHIEQTTSPLSTEIEGRELKENIEPSTQDITTKEASQETTTEEAKDVASEAVIVQEENIENVPKVATRGITDAPSTQQAQLFNMPESTLDNDQYLYEKNITEDMQVKSFKHDIALYKEQICSVYFENNTDEDVILYIQDIDGNKVSQDTVVPKNSNNFMEFYMTDEEREQDVYTINAESTNLNLQGYLKVEVMDKE